jgi:predicted Zn-dependent protease
MAMAIGCGTLSVPQERQLGAEMQREIRSQVVLVRDRVVNDYVSDIGNKIVRAAGPQPFEYRFHVIEDEDLNAFAAPAGYIYIHTGTIQKARNVSELAGVMAHEVGHVAERHIAENYNRMKNTGLAHQALVLGAGIAGGGTAAGAANLLGGVAGMAYLNSFSRDAEVEADAFAVAVLPAAGYDPRGLVTFFETLQRERLIAESHLPPTLRVDDGGRLEIIQRRIQLITKRP